MKSMIFCLTVLALAGSAAAADVRAARHAPDVLETTVRFGDLNLNRTSGADLLLSRLGRAARAVCGEAPGVRDGGKRRRYRACLRTAVDNAVAEVDAPLVSARHSRRDTTSMAAR